MSQIDEEYLTWLYARIGSVKEARKSKTYWSLFRYLQSEEFIWLIPNDDNRVEDGRYMRYEFLDEMGGYYSVKSNWMGAGCSVLEMLFGLANRLAFVDDSTELHWFWELLTNLGLSGYNDRSFDERPVADIVGNLIWRTYSPDGRGGMFPLRNPREDQTHAEIWVQMNSYIQDRH